MSGIHDVTIGDSWSLRLASPGGTHIGAIPAIVGQIFPTGTLPLSPFPGILVNPNAPGLFFLFDGTNAGILGAFTLPSAGITLNVTIPPALAGISVLVQGYALTMSAANGFVASTEGTEIRG